MPCQCGTTATQTIPEPDVASGGCECGCGAPAPGAPAPPADREVGLERLVMEMDRRLRRLEEAR